MGTIGVLQTGQLFSESVKESIDLVCVMISSFSFEMVSLSSVSRMSFAERAWFFSRF